MSALFGVSCAVLSGACDGSYGVVMKITKNWAWENIWLVFSVLALAVFPLALAIWSAPDLIGVYRSVEPLVLWRTLLLGFGWGIGSVFFGLGLYLLGQSIAYTVMMGMIAVIGAMVPMWTTSAETLTTMGGKIIVAAMLVMVFGVTLCGIAGKIRDEQLAAAYVGSKPYRSFLAAFMICVGGGIFSSMFNLAFHYGAPIAAATAAQLGESAATFRANSPIWALAMLGGFVPNALYCVYLLTKNGTWSRFRAHREPSYWLWALTMGAVFAVGITCYGVGASNLGKLGTTVAWLVFVATGILIANLWGLGCGEWRGAPARAGRFMQCGSLMLLVSIVLVSYGNYLLP
jgi:L-rhamnose-H+ transport protein